MNKHPILKELSATKINTTHQYNACYWADKYLSAFTKWTPKWWTIKLSSGNLFAPYFRINWGCQFFNRSPVIEFNNIFFKSLTDCNTFLSDFIKRRFSICLHFLMFFLPQISVIQKLFCKILCNSTPLSLRGIP